MPDHLFERLKDLKCTQAIFRWQDWKTFKLTIFFIDLGKSDYQFINGFSFCLGTYYDHENLSSADCLPLSRPTFDCLDEVWNKLQEMWGDRKKCPERNLDIEIESTTDVNSDS